MTQPTEMTDEELRVAVAEACGWKPLPAIFGCDMMGNKFPGADDPPPFATSLDACSTFEGTMTDDERLAFGQKLCRLLGLDPYKHISYAAKIAFAEPRLRCLAFLAVKSKTA